MGEQQNDKISLDKLQKFINCKSDFYEATIRNGYYLPNEKCSLITEQYINGVISGKLWFPQFKDIKLLPCPKPP